MAGRSLHTRLKAVPGSCLRRRFKALWRDAAGVSAMEFAIIAPVLVVLGLGTAEFGRLLLLTQKMQNGSFVLADLVTRDATISEAQLQDLFGAFVAQLQPFAFAERGAAVVSSVEGEKGGKPVLNWQRSGAGDLSVQSEIGGKEGGKAKLPDALRLEEGETLIVAEVFYDFELFFGMLPVEKKREPLRKVAYFKPRFGTLTDLDP